MIKIKMGYYETSDIVVNLWIEVVWTQSLVGRLQNWLCLVGSGLVIDQTLLSRIAYIV